MTRKSNNRAVQTSQTSVLLLMFAALLSASAAQTLAQNAPGDSAPDWIKPGTRITFYGTAASIPGTYNQLVEDENGRWVDQATGKRYSEQDIPGAAGQGLTQVNVAYLDAQTVALHVRAYGIDISSGGIRTIGSTGYVGPAHTGSDYWVHPARLMSMREQNTPELKILRMPYALGGKTYSALRIQTRNASGYSQHTYDLETGVLLISGAATQGPAVAQRNPGGIVTPAEGSTQLVQTRLLAIRDLDLPWNNLPAPASIARTRSLTYSGTHTAFAPGANPFTLALIARLDITRTGQGWAQYTQLVEMQSIQAMPPMRTQTEHTIGTSTLGGLWIPPQALGRLQRGQQLDSDPLTRMTCTVTAVGGHVTLTESGAAETTEFTYDARSGLLVGTSQTQNLGLSSTRTSVSLQRQE